MLDIQSHNLFSFLKVQFNTYHYTDNRCGSPFHYFAYLEKGNCKIVSKNKSILINEGDVFYIPKSLKYQSYWHGKEEITFLSLGCDNLFSYDCKNLSLQTINCPDDLKKKILKIPPVGTEVKAQIIGDFFSTVAMFLPYMTKEPISNTMRILNDAKDYLSTNFNCSNKQLAKACNVSISYLYKVFKETENTTPNQYRQLCLCKKAVELLTTTDKSIEDISAILNISSSSYFRKIFKQKTGNTPKEIRKHMLL